MRGGIAEKGGVRVGHRIIEINSELFHSNRNQLQTEQFPIFTRTWTYPQFNRNLSPT